MTLNGSVDEHRDVNRRVYVSTACMRGIAPLTRRLADYEAAGLRLVELGAGVTIEENDLGFVQRSLGGRCLIHGYFPPPAKSFVFNLSSPSAEVRDRSCALARAAVDLSVAVSAPFYSFHGGFIVDPTGFGDTSFSFDSTTDEEASSRALDRFVFSVERLLDETRDSGIQLLVENNVCPRSLIGKLLLQTTEEFVALFERVRNPRLGILLDTGHLNVSARTHGFDPVGFVDRLGDYIRGVHLHANEGNADTHAPVDAHGWPLQVLLDRKLANIPIVIEAKFNSAEALAQHTDWIAARLN